MDFIGAIVERRPPVWRRLAQWYAGSYRRMKNYADAEGEAPTPRVTDYFASWLGCVATMCVAGFANTWNAWLWTAFLPIAAVGLPLFWQFLRSPGGILGPGESP